MKVGIITICDYKNYGNRLQNYASQEVLKSLGCQVETIVNIPPKNETKVEKNLKYYFSKVKGNNIKDLIKKINNKLNFKANNELHAKRVSAFKKFTKQYINETLFTITEESIPEDLADKYDFFVVGSDQVWNPIFRRGFSVDFLTFAPRKKRIAYAPSFGISTIPEEFRNQYKLWLSEMEYLSVREDAGAQIIKELTGRDALVLVDPTLMLSKEQWLSISKPVNNKPNNGYILTYFLGDISKETNLLIKKIAKENNLSIINLATFNHREYYTIDPSEFIDLINSSSIFLTDSFHGCVFSILLEKPFIVFNRQGKTPSMSSRIDTLLTKFKLESRKAENISKVNDIFDVDYSHTSPILERERIKTINYLKEALNIK